MIESFKLNNKYKVNEQNKQGFLDMFSDGITDFIGNNVFRCIKILDLEH